MPLHTIQFNLPDENEELQTVIRAPKYVSAIYDFAQYLRSEIKYKENDLRTEEILQHIRTKFYEILNENDIGDEF